MTAMILISTAAILVAIVGCAVIWRMDALRADEIEQAYERMLKGDVKYRFVMDIATMA